MKQTVVLGGGVIGLSIALKLALEGIEVTLLEKQTCGGQASGAAAGMLAPFSEIGEDPDDFFEFCLAGLREFKSWQQLVKDISGMDFDYSEVGSLHCVYHEADLLSLETRKAWQEKYGAEMTILYQDQLAEQEPLLSKDIIGALYNSEEAHVYAPDYVKALEQACIKKGVIIFEELGDVSLAELEGTITLVTETGQTFSAQTLIVATGAWAHLQADRFHVKLPLYPIRGQICAYQFEEQRLNHIIYTSQGYLVPKANQTIVNGASEDIAGYRTDVTEKGIQRLLNWNKRMMPMLEEVEPFHTWAGLRPATQDGFPFIGRLTDYPNVYFACGHYRNGILLSAITAEVVKQELLGQELAISLESFRPERFT
ncbi:glycine oxidase ThiO [Bacillus sp. JCM 19046]|nr:glycine oxidase ThiO [Bacillus sp. JCM 19045]GAF19367.1 glycine oxidase ThiO [Bacillus sp. JCM 19046]